MSGMKINQFTCRIFSTHCIPPTLKRKNPRNKILAQTRVMEPTIIFKRQIRKEIHHHACPQANPIMTGHALVVEHLDATHSVRGRPVPKNIAAQILLLKTLQPFRPPLAHAGRPIFPRSPADQTDIAIAPDQSNGFPRNRHPGLNLGTNWNPLDILTERIPKEPVKLVRTVIPHLFPKETPCNTYPDLTVVSHHDSPLIRTGIRLYPLKPHQAKKDLSQLVAPSSGCGQQHVSKKQPALQGKRVVFFNSAPGAM